MLKFSGHAILLLIIAFASTALFMIGPVEDADAWKAHVCEFSVAGKDNDGNFKIRIEVEAYIHDHWGSCGFSCP